MSSKTHHFLKAIVISIKNTTNFLGDRIISSQETSIFSTSPISYQNGFIACEEDNKNNEKMDALSNLSFVIDCRPS